MHYRADKMMLAAREVAAERGHQNIYNAITDNLNYITNSNDLESMDYLYLKGEYLEAFRLLETKYSPSTAYIAQQKLFDHGVRLVRVAAYLNYLLDETMWVAYGNHKITYKNFPVPYFSYTLETTKYIEVSEEGIWYLLPDMRWQPIIDGKMFPVVKHRNLINRLIKFYQVLEPQDVMLEYLLSIKNDAIRMFKDFESLHEHIINARNPIVRK